MKTPEPPDSIEEDFLHFYSIEKKNIRRVLVRFMMLLVQHPLKVLRYLKKTCTGNFKIFIAAVEMQVRLSC